MFLKYFFELFTISLQWYHSIFKSEYSIHLKWDASSLWSLSLYYLMRNLDEMTIEKMHSTLDAVDEILKIEWYQCKEIVKSSKKSFKNTRIVYDFSMNYFPYRVLFMRCGLWSLRKIDDGNRSVDVDYFDCFTES